MLSLSFALLLTLGLSPSRFSLPRLCVGILQEILPARAAVYAVTAAGCASPLGFFSQSVESAAQEAAEDVVSEVAATRVLAGAEQDRLKQRIFKLLSPAVRMNAGMHVVGPAVTAEC